MTYKPILKIIILLAVSVLFSCGKGEHKKKSRPNILLITIDTLRRDHVGVYGYLRETSPFIDELARKGLKLKHVITPIPATSGSHASILTSLHPITHNVISNGAFLSNKVQTMAEVLRQNGYYTVGTVAVKILSAKYNFSQGFESFSDKWSEEVNFIKSSQRTAQSVNESLFKQIDEYLLNHKKKPLFIWVHYFDPHTPYRAIPEINFKIGNRENEHWKAIRRYDKEIRYTDEHIKSLFNYLEETGISRKLVTCITADHGEQFGEHGYAKCHADFYSETTLVPLIFYGFGIPGNKVIDKFVSTMDIAVTLLGRAGLSFDYPTEGIDLLNTGNKPGPHRDRKFLIIGYPYYTKSIQLLRYPFDYILNFDYFYRHWIITDKNHIPAKRLKPIHKRHIKRKGNTMIISLPPILKKGLNYAVFHADIKENRGFSVKVKTLPNMSTKEVHIDHKIKHLNIIYPATIPDHISVNLELKKGTVIEKLGYTFIREKEFLQHPGFKQKMKNGVFDRLKTLRKDKEEDEFFDLTCDPGMENNLIKKNKFTAKIREYKKLIYAAFNYYYQKKKLLLKKFKQKRSLTGKEKKQLESLGYL